MNHRERVWAILHDRAVDRVPLVSFGFWKETLYKWAAQGHIQREDAENYELAGDNGPGDRRVMDALGFDFNWGGAIGGEIGLFPPFEEIILSRESDGSQLYRDSMGHIQRRKPGIISIPAEIGTLLTDRAAWESEYLSRLRDSADRVDGESLRAQAAWNMERGLPTAIYCGSMFGRVRDMLGVLGLSYMMADDEALFKEIVDTCANLAYSVVERTLSLGIPFDYAHFWEDICYKNGPLISPKAFRELVGHHYSRITSLLLAHGIDVVSVDCDGKIDQLVPIWLENGVNTMFPIEVGTWNASIAPWRALYGKVLRGVGGMDKRVFARDKAAVDEEIERLKPLVDLGGFIPCPDHRIAPDAEYALVEYFCEKYRKAFG